VPVLTDPWVPAFIQGLNVFNNTEFRFEAFLPVAGFVWYNNQWDRPVSIKYTTNSWPVHGV